jgi:putative DNA primase/helicase
MTSLAFMRDPQAEPVAEFRATLEAAGAIPPADLIADGKWHPCATVDKPGKQNGRYRLHLDPPVNGLFWNHATGEAFKWRPETGQARGPLSEAERAEIQAAKAKREAEAAEAQAEAVTKARRYLAGLPPATADNPYLKRKGVAPCPGLLADGDLLVVPVLGTDGAPMSYQAIPPDGIKKRFAFGCTTRDGFFVTGPKGGDGPLLLAEGLATALSCFEATGWPCLVAFNAGNLAAVARMARTRYPERKLILCADNDTETEARTGKNPGIEAAQAAAAAVGGLLAFPPAGDFNDLATAEGPEAVKRIIEGAEPVETVAEIAVATAEEWPEPLPLAPNEKTEPYPVEALPGAIGEAVAEVTGFVQCPVALTACSALAAVSTVAAGLADCRRAGRLSGPIGLFFLALADSGERKTTVDGFFTKAIRHWEAEQEEAHRPVVQAWRAADDAWKAERDGLLMAIREASKRGKDTAELKTKLADLETRKPERPKVPQLLIGDATSEALTWRLAHKWPVGGLLSAEAGVVFGGHAMGRDSIMRNLATLNSLWDAAAMSVERKTSECFTIRAARLSACLAAQPGTVRQWLENCRGLARESGFLARFLVAQPESTQGRRMFQEAPEHWPALSRFHRRLADLLDHPLRFEERGALAPVVLDLDPAAKAAWIEFHDTIEAELAPGGDMAEARDVASKAGDNAARLAALFHVFEHGPAGTVSADDMRRAAGIVAWHLFEARRFLNQIAVPEAVADAIALEAWMIQKCKADHLAALPISVLHKSAPNRLRKKAPLEAALDELESAYRIRRRREGKKIEIEINPEIMGGDHGA